MYGVATPLCVGVNFPTPTFTKEKVHFRFLFSGEEPHIIFLPNKPIGASPRRDEDGMVLF